MVYKMHTNRNELDFKIENGKKIYSIILDNHIDNVERVFVKIGENMSACIVYDYFNRINLLRFNLRKPERLIIEYTSKILDVENKIDIYLMNRRTIIIKGDYILQNDSQQFFVNLEFVDMIYNVTYHPSKRPLGYYFDEKTKNCYIGPSVYDKIKGDVEITFISDSLDIENKIVKLFE